MKLKELAPILSPQEIILYDGEIHRFIDNGYGDYFDNDNDDELFKKYGEREIEQLYDGDYDSISIDLKY